MYLARKAIEPYKEYLSTAEFGTNPDGGPGVIIYPIDSSPSPTTFKFRSDYEFHRDGEGFEEFFRTGHLTENEINDLFDQLEYDLEDYIIFADANEVARGFVNNYQFEGVIKRQAVPVDIKLRAARTYREYKTMKDAVELTTYVRLDVKWEE
jgi:hypothetical protein